MIKTSKTNWTTRSLVLTAVALAMLFILVIPSYVYVSHTQESPDPTTEVTAVPTQPTGFVPSPHIHVFEYTDKGIECCISCGYLP